MLKEKKTVFSDATHHSVLEGKLVQPLWRAIKIKNAQNLTSLAVQWLRLRAPNTGGAGSIGELRSHMPRDAAKKKKKSTELIQQFHYSTTCYYS